MTIQQGGEYTVSLSQKDDRFYAAGNNVEYSQCRFVIAKRTQDGL